MHLHYFRNTIAAIDREGGNRVPASKKLVIADGWDPLEEPQHPLPRPWWLLCTAGGDGPAAFFRALAWASGSGEDLLFFEDDVELCGNAVAAAERIRVWDDLAFVALFDADHAREQHGLRELPFPGPSFRCSQALKIPPWTIEYLIAKGPPKSEEAKDGIDTMLGRRLCRSPWPRYGIVVPNFAKHVGRVSAIRRDDSPEPLTKLRTPNHWPDGFDALTWTP